MMIQVLKSFRRSRARQGGWANVEDAPRARRGWSPGPVESLEGRALLATQGVDYVLSGDSWANPAHVTYSIAPDGVFWDHGTNNLNAALRAKLGAGLWEREVARALATWEAAANINIGQVADSANDLDTRGLSQGDPRFGDIRFGGYPFVGNTTTLAQTYFPPPNGTTAAGDVVLNTAMDFHQGSQYDLFSVLLHETGHSLGLDHPTNPAEVMSPSYHGVVSGLAPGDLAGIQALYGPRTLDAYQQQGKGLSLATAVDVSAALNASGQAAISNVSLATAGATEYFSVTAPSGASGGLQVTAATHGLSLLSPKVTLYDASGHPVDTASNASAWGDDVSAGVSGVTPGRRYYVAVTGATGDVFSVGAYVLHVAFAVTPATPTPTPPAPTPTPTPPAPAPAPAPAPPPPPLVVAVPPDRLEPNGSFAQATSLGSVTQTIIPGLTLHSPGDKDYFVFQTSRGGVYYVGANGANVTVLDGFGRTIVSGTSLVGLRVFRPKTKLYVEVTSANGQALPGYSLAIAAASKAAVARPRARREQTEAASFPRAHSYPSPAPFHAGPRGRSATRVRH